MSKAANALCRFKSIAPRKRKADSLSVNRSTQRTLSVERPKRGTQWPRQQDMVAQEPEE